MKAIILKFKTKKGEEAYHKVDAEGKKQPYMDRKISKSVAKDSILSKNPLVVKIKIKVKFLAVKIKLDHKVEEALQKFGAKKDIDYKLEVLY